MLAPFVEYGSYDFISGQMVFVKCVKRVTPLGRYSFFLLLLIYV